MLNEIEELVCFGYNGTRNCVLILAFPSVVENQEWKQQWSWLHFVFGITELHKKTINIF